MSTCETASAVDPDDAFEPEDCEQRLQLPGLREAGPGRVREEHPVRAVGRPVGPGPGHPVSAVGRTAPDFEVDSFAISYGDPQTGRGDRPAGPAQPAAALPDQRRPGPARPTGKEWQGGERYGDEGDVYYAEYRASVRGADPGDKVEVWFTGDRRPARAERTSEPFTYTAGPGHRQRRCW